MVRARHPGVNACPGLEGGWVPDGDTGKKARRKNSIKQGSRGLGVGVFLTCCWWERELWVVVRKGRGREMGEGDTALWQLWLGHWLWEW